MVLTPVYHFLTYKTFFHWDNSCQLIYSFLLQQKLLIILLNEKNIMKKIRTKSSEIISPSFCLFRSLFSFETWHKKVFFLFSSCKTHFQFAHEMLRPTLFLRFRSELTVLKTFLFYPEILCVILFFSIPEWIKQETEATWEHFFISNKTN